MSGRSELDAVALEGDPVTAAAGQQVEVEVDSPRRIVFTWGWEVERSPL
jgi:uncharacterized protein YndB with AHSA1/START domain